jgi:hypothetical protein
VRKRIASGVVASCLAWGVACAGPDDGAPPRDAAQAAAAEHTAEASHVAGSLPSSHHPAGAGGAGAPGTASHHATVGEGVTGLDVVARSATVDLLVAETAGEVTRLVFRRSPDGGVSWTPGVEVPTGDHHVAPPQRGAEPQIAAAGDRLLVVWTARGSSPWGTGPLSGAASDDGGVTWTAVASPADDGGTDGHGFLDLAAGEDGTFHAVWLDGRGGRGQGLRYSRSSDGGRTWSANATLDERTCECCWNDLLVEDGEVTVSYRDHEPRDLRVLASRDGGAGWSDEGRPGAFDWRIEGCPHVGGALARAAGGLVALDWTGREERVGLYVAMRRDGAWTTPLPLGGAQARHGDLAASGVSLVAVWDDLVDGRRALRWARSADRGATWTPAQAIDTGEHPSHPRVVATASGTLVLWTEGRAGAPARWRSARLPAAAS